MTVEEHIKRHEELHKMLDELIADAITNIAGFRPSTATVFSLMEWSAKQADPFQIDHLASRE